MWEDVRLFLQIRNSIDNEVIGLINYCEFFKELMDYLDFLYSGKGNISCIFDCLQSFLSIRETKLVSHNIFYGLKKRHEEFNMLLLL